MVTYDSSNGNLIRSLFSINQLCPNYVSSSGFLAYNMLCYSSRSAHSLLVWHHVSLLIIAGLVPFGISLNGISLGRSFPASSFNVFSSTFK